MATHHWEDDVVLSTAAPSTCDRNQPGRRARSCSPCTAAVEPARNSVIRTVSAMSQMTSHGSVWWTTTAVRVRCVPVRRTYRGSSVRSASVTLLSRGSFVARTGIRGLRLCSILLEHLGRRRPRERAWSGSSPGGARRERPDDPVFAGRRYRVARASRMLLHLIPIDQTEAIVRGRPVA